jgi:hypothetical protein
MKIHYKFIPDASGEADCVDMTFVFVFLFGLIIVCLLCNLHAKTICRVCRKHQPEEDQPQPTHAQDIIVVDPPPRYSIAVNMPTRVDAEHPPHYDDIDMAVKLHYAVRRVS